uniref:NADH-ubiquinone oxidoreductase chain 4 n=2 Tax=unclassified Megaspilidae TaxID=1253067 RepID=A0A3Q8U9X8_9HYME|nr:NADH dehydrogenase subunit 4 [Megaspilidae sp. SJW-2015]AZL93342.1 NADH dehydrogenase subunit 4 [Megaspilidae sp. ZJUH_2016022]
MKLLLFNLSLFFFLFSIISYYYIQLMFMIMIILLILLVNGYSNDLFEMIYWEFGVDNFSFILVLLIYWVMFMIVLASLTSLNSNFFNNLFMFYFLILVNALFLVFMSTNVLLFYVFFELSLIPMFLLIVGWGVQFHRLEAAFYMFIYTFLFSLPLLVSLAYLDDCGASPSFLISNFSLTKGFYLFLFMNLGFLVKLPVYMLHLWLPKAHVEASVGGSMILASVMLKLGSYGILRFMLMYLWMYQLNYLLLVVVASVGSLLASLVCLRQMDLKVLVAYSSIVHMGVLLSGMILLNSVGVLGGLMMMISHGLCSSGMFALVNFLYERLSSRSMFIIKGMLMIFPYLTCVWFMITVNNMSSPPSLSLFGEYFLFLVISFKSIKLMILVSFTLFFSACYSIFFYAYSQYGKLNNNLYFMKNIFIREYLIILMHLIPLNLIFLNLFIFS